jgi:integrase
LAQKLAQDAEREQWATAYADHDVVIVRENGDPIHPERVTKRFTQLVKTSGLRPVRLHDLRHGRASLLLASGTDIALVSKMLGHSSITLTADTYSHLLAGVGQLAADAADALIPRTPRDQWVTTGDADKKEGPTRDDGEGPLTCGDGGTPVWLR